MTREDVHFTVDGARCDGWLYRPPASAPVPLVLMVHGLGGIREARLEAYAERFVAAGLAVLTFDHRGLGTSEGPKGLVGIRAQQRDVEVALAFARALPGIDPDRIALWGTSFGGGHVIEIAARDRRVAAVVAQAPFTHGPRSVLALGPVSALGVGSIGMADFAGSRVKLPPLLAPMVATPGLPAFLATDDAAAGMIGLLPEGTRMSRTLSRHFRRFAAKRFPLPPGVSESELPEPVAASRLVGSLVTPAGTAVLNGLAARLSLAIPFWRPGRALRQVRCPALVCVADADAVTPPGPTLAYARAAGPGIAVRRYPCTHFTIYLGDVFEQAVADQTAFLTAHLATTAPPATKGVSAA